MIYANFDKTVEGWEEDGHFKLYKSKNILSTNEYTPEDESPIFYYDRHDLAIRSIEFNNFLEFDLWKVFKTNPKSKIVINFSDDYLNILDIKRISRVIKIKALDTSRIYFIAMDELFVQFINEEFSKTGIKGVNVLSYPFLLKNVVAPPKIENINKTKFSSLSRNYHPWRLELYARLKDKGLLEDFTYSFHNLLPYHPDPDVTLEGMKSDLRTRKYPLSSEVLEWIKGIPYDIGSADNKWNNVTYDAIYSSDFHLLIESHFDCYLDNIWAFAKDDFDEKEFAPAFATEKTYKAINCKVPFIAVSTPYFLEGLQKMGYKTFSPYIDESYDTIVDNKKRIKAIVAEVERICTLPQDEYEKLIINLKPIVEHNFKVFVNYHLDDSTVDTEEFLNQLLPFTSNSMVPPTLNPLIY